MTRAITFLLLIFAGGVMAQGVTSESLDTAISNGVKFLLRQQRLDGSWLGPQHTHYRSMTGLVVYTLLKCGLPEDHPSVRLGLSWLDREEFHRTYDLGVALMAYGALRKPPKKRMAAMAKKLVDSLGNGSREMGGRWGYPNDHGGNNENWVDLSNTQYAALGLKAALQVGIDAGSMVFWTRVAEDLVDDQDAYGGFGYRRGQKITASMTVAGLTTLIICQEALATKGRAGVSGKVRVGIQRAFEWLESHYSVEKALDPRDASGFTSRWYLYYMYGLERVCSFTDRAMLGDRDWHREGCAVLIGRQKKTGEWGGGDADTCFALLFLRRGSRTSGLGPRAQAAQAEASKAPFSIAGNGEPESICWVRTTNKPLKDLMLTGERPIYLCWYLNDEEKARHALTSWDQVFDEGCFFKRAFEENGDHVVRATVEFQSGKVFKSNQFMVSLDDIEEPWHREGLRDHEANLLRGLGVTVQASSFLGGGNPPSAAVDHRHASPWLAKRDDKDPWIRFSLKPAVRAQQLKITSAKRYGSGGGRFGRPKDIEVRINRGQSIPVRLADTGDAKQSLVLGSAKMIRDIEIRILSAYPGSGGNRDLLGISELEVFRKPHAEDGPPLEKAPTYILPLARHEPALWRYTLTKPPETWTQFKFRDIDWMKGEMAFGSPDASVGSVRTEWNSRDLWARREFRMPRGLSGKARIEINHDDGARVWINGVLAVDASGFSKGGYRTIAVTPEAQEAINPGRNVIAVHCENTGGPGYLDCAIVVIEE